jgi:hypothetical protein
VKDSETLWAARDIIQRGWCKGALSNIYGDVCLAGAIAQVTGGFILNLPVLAALRETLTGRTDGSGSLVHFNDNPNTTKQDVLDLIEKTAIRLEEQGL